MSIVAAILANKIYTGIAVAGIGMLAGPLVKLILSKIPTEDIKKWTGDKAYKLGVLVTTLLGKKISGINVVWNSCIEPWVILLLETVVTNCLSEFIRGLRSDNDKE